MAWKCKLIKFGSYEEALIFITDDNKIFPLILEGYRYLVKNNLKSLDLVEIRYGGLEDFRICLNSQDSTKTLVKLINWLESQERYEECQEFLKLRGKL